MHNNNIIDEALISMVIIVVYLYLKVVKSNKSGIWNMPRDSGLIETESCLPLTWLQSIA